MLKAGLITQGKCEIWIQIWKLKNHFSLNSFVYKLMMGSSKNIFYCVQNAFEHNKKKPGLNLTPGYIGRGFGYEVIV